MQATGLCMHVLADTWAHRYFCGTTSLVINNVDDSVRELMNADGTETRPITFVRNPGRADDVFAGAYSATMFVTSENSVMNLGHGRAGHVPDYSFLRYRYQPAWAEYEEVEKNNPEDYYHAFTQMIYALRFLRGDTETFEKEQYAFDAVAPHESEIRSILTTRQGENDACLAWKAFGEKLSGSSIPDFSLETHQQEYIDAQDGKKNDTFLGRYILAALAQKSMVTNRIHRSGNVLAGRSIDYNEKGLRGLRDYWALVFSLEEADDE